VVIAQSPSSIRDFTRPKSTGGGTAPGPDPARRCGTTIQECPDLFPEGLLSPPVSNAHLDGNDNRCWWLAHTRPRQEKAVAAAIRERGVGYYLPILNRKCHSRGRTRIARITLFPGYLFAWGDENDRLHVLKTNRVLTVRQVPDGEQLRRDLLRFSELIAMGAPLVPESRLVEGDRVRVKAGPFRDTEGVVLRRNGKTELLISVDFLQQGASMEIDDCMLEPV